MKLLLIVTVLTVVFHSAVGIRVRNPLRGRFSNESAFSIESRIIGGEVATDGFAPYHVSIQTINIGSHICSGTIIDESWIITAGHCAIGWNPSKIQISSGTNDIWDPQAYYYPDKIIIHCNYDNPLYHNDIALIHLDSPIEWDAKTQKIEIATELLPKGSKAVITGWGKLELNGFISRDLLKANVDYIPYENCKERYRGDNAVDVGHICTLAGEGVGVCHGDSGAPLVSDGKLVGIVNWGEPCARGYPDVHASVFFYHDWIRTSIEGCMHQLD